MIDPIEQRALVWRLVLLPAIATIAVVASIMIAMATATGLPGIPDKSNSGIPDDYSELQFSVIHRPLVTYLIDRRYQVCLAVGRPGYRDLVRLPCTRHLLTAGSSTVRGRAPAPESPPDAGRPDR